MSDDDFGEFDDFDDGAEINGGGKTMLSKTVLALLLGLGTGAVIANTFFPPDPILEMVPRDLSGEELELACAPFIVDATAKLEESHTKVETLTAKVKAKEAYVADLEDKMSKRAAQGRKLVRELKEAKAELTTLREKLEVAEAEKASLSAELKATVARLTVTSEDLAKQKNATRRAKNDAVMNKWSSFVNDAQLSICQRGFKRGMTKCRDAVKTSLSVQIQDRYAHCIRAGQQAPNLFKVDKKNELPMFAEWLNEDDRRMKRWAVGMCDPTLPEVGTYADLPGLRATPTMNLDVDLDELDD
jgi:peptidoglycan hydrolase CwlO-like protein